MDSKSFSSQKSGVDGNKMPFMLFVITWSRRVDSDSVQASGKYFIVKLWSFFE